MRALRMVHCLLAGIATLLLLADPLKADALIIDGEEIADAKLMAAARQEGRIVIYGTYFTEAITPVLEQFKKDTKIEYEYTRLPTARMYDRVLAEFSAGKLLADYADLTDLTLIKEWVARGVLAPHKVPSFDKIADELKDPNGHWVYVLRPIFVVGVNTAEIPEKDYPESWADTLNPKWKGKLGMQSIDAGGSAVTLHAFLRRTIGDDVWKRIAAIEPRLYATMSPGVSDMVRGRTPITYVDSGSMIAQIEAKAPLKMIFPKEGVPAFGSLGNITAGAKHPNAARVYVNYVTSKFGSTLVSKTGAYGTHPDSPPPTVAGYTFPPRNKVWTISAKEWEGANEAWKKEWRQIILKR